MERHMTDLVDVITRCDVVNHTVEIIQHFGLLLTTFRVSSS